MTKQYQTQRFDTSALAVPERVNLAMADIAGDMREGLLALAVGAGLQVMSALMDADVAALAGPRGRHNGERVAVRHGTDAGRVTLGGRRVGVQRPRVRAADGSGELAVPAYELFNDTEILGKMAMERMLAGLSTRRYGLGLEPVGAAVTEVREGHEQVGGLAQVREDDRDGPGRPARRGPVRAEPGRLDGRWRPLRRDVLRRRPRDRHRRRPCTRWPWSRARPRTPPWSPSCASGCVSVART